ncbi:GerMN domain-containing protein [Sporanaerobium hydrogeniformans]|uniref:GerMN domain-containing protein n=1 Tax=Sporanaerobium hydrogeniformans TaxID=3072179 RepID=UPI0015D52242|nr:GerMN domain-containing protein [Sporanaerobium hydrogeniformans]
MVYKKGLKVLIFIITFLMLCLECRTIYGSKWENSSLTKRNKDAKIEESITVYMGNMETEALEYEKAVLSYTNGENIKGWNEIFAYYKIHNRELIPPISNEAKLLDMRVDKEKNQVTIDMSNNYAQMNWGHMGEYLALKSLAYTIGHYYGIGKICITLEGQPYVSGHYFFTTEDVWIVEDLNKVGE